MKKPLFVIAEIFLSAVFVAAAAATAAVAVDIKTDMFKIDKLDPLKISSLLTHDNESENQKNKKELSEIILAESKQVSDTKENLQKMAEIKSKEFYFSNTSKAKLYCYEKAKNGYWWNVVGEGETVTDEVYIGENGSSYEATADSKKTPAGMWELGEGFYIGEKPVTSYPMFEITENTYWVTDTQSQFFNQRVEGIEEKDWTKAEHTIASEKSYQYGLVINYNMYEPDIEKPAGLFMHCGNTPTEGCIAVPESVMKSILEWLDSDSNPVIWVTV